MVKRLWRFFLSFLGAAVAGVQLGDGPAGQGIAPIARYLRRRAKHKAALAHQWMGDGEGGRVAVKRPAAPQQDIEIEHPARPGLTPPAAEFRFDVLEPVEQVRGIQSRFNECDSIGIGPLGGTDWPRGDYCGYFGNTQIVRGKPLDRCSKNVTRQAKALVALVRTEGDQIEHMRQSRSCAIQKGRERNKGFQAGVSAAIMQSMSRKSRRSFVRQHHIALSSVALLSLMVAGCSKEGVSPGEVSGNVARAALVGADQAQYGEVIVAQGDNGLLVNIKAQGMSPGQHGVHIHETGKCVGPDFKSAGGHWNPASKQHGFDNPQGAHAGDFFNLDIGADGTGALEALVRGATLRDGENALLDADGAAFVVHAGPDDLKTDPSGESGGRIACGVFVGGR